MKTSRLTTYLFNNPGDGGWGGGGGPPPPPPPPPPPIFPYLLRRYLTATVVVLTLTFSLLAACKPKEILGPMQMTTAEPESLEEPTTASEYPADTSSSVGYDTALYGNLATLDLGGQIVIYWHRHTRSHEQLLLSMIDEFNRTNEWGIVVFAESQGNDDDLHQRIIDGIRDNRLPNIATASHHRTAAYAAQGVLVPLAPYMESEEWGYSEEELDDFFPAALAADILPQFGIRYGWSPYRLMEVMVYNEDWLAELGYMGPPTTWDEFAEMACIASEQPFSRAADEGSTYGYVYSVSPSLFATFLFSRGGNVVNERGTGYVFSSPEGLESLAFLKSLVDQGCATGQTESHGDRDFGLGQSLFIIDSTARLSYYGNAVDEGAGFNWGVSPPPHVQATPRMNTYGASQLIFVSRPEEQLAAWLFIKWMSEPEQLARWARGTGYFPIRASTADLLTDYFAQYPAYEKAFAFMALDYGVESPVAGYDECREVISEVLVAILNGEDAQSQLDSAVERCNEYLEDAAP
jgi:multiple sugar transport system substrate-binding protein